jgi:hypothetical protein
MEVTLLWNTTCQFWHQVKDSQRTFLSKCLRASLTNSINLVKRRSDLEEGNQSSIDVVTKRRKKSRGKLSAIIKYV